MVGTILNNKVLGCIGKITEILPPVTKKYDKRTIENINIADGCFTHPGLFSFRFGTSKTVNGILKIASMM